MKVVVTPSDFFQDRQGRTFKDLLKDPRFDLAACFAFFNDLNRQRRMCEAETEHDRPALAGVVKELEREFEAVLTLDDAHITKRFHQFIGVVVRVYMEKLGWHTTGLKNSVGPASVTKWFGKSERYQLNN